jgi:hypothetical protein
MPGLWLFQYAFRNGGSVPHCCVTANCSEDNFFFNSVGSGFLKSFMFSGSKVDASAGCAELWRTTAARPAANNTTAAIPAILIEFIYVRRRWDEKPYNFNTQMQRARMPKEKKIPCQLRTGLKPAAKETLGF